MPSDSSGDRNAEARPTAPPDAHDDEAGEHLQRDVAAHHVAEQTKRQGDGAQQEGHELDQDHERQDQPRHARRHEQLEEAQAMLGEADGQHQRDGQHAECGGDGDLRGRREGQEQAEEVHGQDEGEDREDEREKLAAVMADDRIDDAVDHAEQGLARGLSAARHDLGARR